MLATTDTIVTVAGGVLIALITAGFAFAGVLVNARAQKAPTQVRTSDDQIDRLKDRVAELIQDVEYLRRDRDWWRDMAKRWAPSRRHEDQVVEGGVDSIDHPLPHWPDGTGLQPEN